MELKHTVDYMLSRDYRERFIAEYWQTKIRYEKLKAFNIRIFAANTPDGRDRKLEEPKHDCPRELLKSQEVSMAEYLETMEKRAAYENIDLHCMFKKAAEADLHDHNPLKGYSQFCDAAKAKD